ncbi:hypothetical protein T265_09414 [Opisthorchis viverrini]|uniref:Uncharacterized protein n=1 Tax=Opisthorchis viverrini TaxID=6198 RepID=A0A074Z5V6_OPIVI|nr:hypothetical protein T265_09414 [Opisthorchis viverrini]KER22521.1 hypothetical protein T265_09414 [Opisthorchis viverrini]
MDNNLGLEFGLEFGVAQVEAKKLQKLFEAGAQFILFRWQPERYFEDIGRNKLASLRSATLAIAYLPASIVLKKNQYTLLTVLLMEILNSAMAVP